MAEKKTTALATLDTFSIVNRYEGMDAETLAELQDELGDLDPENGITCRKIKIPAGGGIHYQVEGEDESDSEMMKEINAVVIFTHRVGGYWPGSYGGDDQNKIPVCASMDGKTGIRSETGEVVSCETCPLNQFGSATDQNGQQSRGKACKNMRRLYLMMSGDPNFYLLTVPPTSIREVNKQLTRIMAGGIPYTGLVLTFKLEKATNANGVAYSKMVITKGGLLPPAVSLVAKEMRRQIKEQYMSLAITAEDYSAAPAQGTPVDISAADFDDAPDADIPPEFQEAPPAPAGEQDLPF